MQLQSQAAQQRQQQQPLPEQVGSQQMGQVQTLQPGQQQAQQQVQQQAQQQSQAMQQLQPQQVLHNSSLNCHLRNVWLLGLSPVFLYQLTILSVCSMSRCTTRFLLFSPCNSSFSRCKFLYMLELAFANLGL
jgi:hypothetical protein